VDGSQGYAALRDAVLAHPTLLEGLIPLFLSVTPSSKAFQPPGLGVPDEALRRSSAISGLRILLGLWSE